MYVYLRTFLLAATQPAYHIVKNITICLITILEEESLVLSIQTRQQQHTVRRYKENESHLNPH